jgi:hypothetical protein
MPGAHLILYHKHPTSARTRFLRLPHGGVCGLDALPADAVLADGAETTVVSHPAMLVRAAEQRLGLAAGSLEGDTGFHCRISTAGGPGDVYLAHFTEIDPPFGAADALGAAFIDLTQARGLAPLELQLLRRAYEHVLG